MKSGHSKIHLIFLLVILSYQSICSGQHSGSDYTTVGFLIEPTFSGFNQHGLTPSVTVGCATYQFQLGPRITFDQLRGIKDPDAKNSQWDFGYRYGFLLRHGFTLYAAARIEYRSHQSRYSWFYEKPDGSDGQEIYLGDNSFNAITENAHYNFNFYLGAGAEFIAVNKLYLTVFGGGGFKTLSGFTDYTNIDTDELMLHSSWILDNTGFSWMVSGGIGYRL